MSETIRLYVDNELYLIPIDEVISIKSLDEKTLIEIEGQCLEDQRNIKSFLDDNKWIEGKFFKAILSYEDEKTEFAYINTKRIILFKSGAPREARARLVIMLLDIGSGRSRSHMLPLSFDDVEWYLRKASARQDFSDILICKTAEGHSQERIEDYTFNSRYVEIPTGGFKNGSCVDLTLGKIQIKTRVVSLESNSTQTITKPIPPKKFVH